jgi:hypothetical protein
MISLSTLNELHSHFGLKKDKLTWDGTLDELKGIRKNRTNSRSRCTANMAITWRWKVHGALMVKI